MVYIHRHNLILRLDLCIVKVQCSDGTYRVAVDTQFTGVAAKK